VFVTCGSFYVITLKTGQLRLDIKDEILGGDIHYFAPIDFIGEIKHYDI